MAKVIAHLYLLVVGVAGCWLVWGARKHLLRSGTSKPSITPETRKAIAARVVSAGAMWFAVFWLFEKSRSTPPGYSGFGGMGEAILAVLCIPLFLVLTGKMLLGSIQEVFEDEEDPVYTSIPMFVFALVLLFLAAYSPRWIQVFADEQSARGLPLYADQLLAIVKPAFIAAMALSTGYYLWLWKQLLADGEQGDQEALAPAEDA